MNELKNDLEIVIDVINRENYNMYYYSDSSDCVYGGYINSSIDSKILNINEKESQAFKHVFYGTSEVIRSYKYQFEDIIRRDNGEILFSNWYGYQVTYIPNDNKNTLKELKKECKDKNYYVIKLTDHWYQIMPN